MQATDPLSSHLSSALLRPLGGLEHVIWLGDQRHRWHFALAAEVAGETLPQDWRGALDAVQRRHRLVGVCVEKTPDGGTFFRQVPGAKIPLRVVSDRSVASAWEQEMAREMARPFEPHQAPLLRATLLHEKRRAVCILTAHHAVADGKSLAFLLRDLLQALAGQPLAALPTPPSLDDLLGLTAEPRPEPTPSDEPGPAWTPNGFHRWDGTPPHVESLRLNAGFTDELRARARGEGTTVHGALGAALVVAADGLRQRKDQDELRLCSPIDLRAALGLGEECVLAIGMSVVAFRRGGSPAFWDLARAVTRGLAPARSVESNAALNGVMRRLMTSRGTADDVTSTCAHGFPHEIMLTNLGSLPFGTSYGALTLMGVWGPCVSMNFEGADTVGVATVGGSVGLLHTSFSPACPLLPTAVQVLKAALEGPAGRESRSAKAHTAGTLTAMVE